MEQPFLSFFKKKKKINPQGPIGGCSVALLPWDTQKRMLRNVNAAHIMDIKPCYCEDVRMKYDAPVQYHFVSH